MVQKARPRLKKQVTIRRKRKVARVRKQVAKQLTRGSMERYRIKNIARRDSMQDYLAERLDIIDPDELIARPLDQAGWDRLIDNGLKGYRAGTDDQFEAWRARREARGGYTDLEIAAYLEDSEDLHVNRMKGAELEKFLERVETFEIDAKFKAWVKKLNDPSPDDARIRKEVFKILGEQFGAKTKP